MASGEEPGAEKVSVARVLGHKVKDFSSQYGAEERMSYSAQNLAGESSIYPSYGDFTQACVFRTYGPWWRMAPSAPKPYCKTPEPHRLASEDYIDVLFDQHLYPVAVQVYETYNPGAIVRILGCDYHAGTNVDTGAQSRWRVLWSGTVTETPRRSRIFSPPIRRIDTKVNLIRLELNHSLLHYYTEMDCIMLCGVTFQPPPDHYSYLQAQTNQTNNLHPSALPLTLPKPPEKKGQWWGGLRKGKEEEEVVGQLRSLHIAGRDDAGDESNSHPQAFSMLPGEIIIMILGYLDFPSLGRVAQTCRLLQRHAYDCILYTELNLQPMWNMVNDSTLGGLADRCDTLQRLNLAWCSDGHANHDAGFLRSHGAGADLQVPEHLRESKFRLLVVGGAVSAARWWGRPFVIKSDCCNVWRWTEDMSNAKLLGSCQSKLTCLELSCSTFVTHDTLRIIASTCKSLKELDVSGCGEVDKVSGVHLCQLADLERLNVYRTEIDTQTIITVIRSLGKLKHLNLGSCKLVTNTAEVVEELGLSCPDLRSLDLWRALNLPNKSFHKFVEGCPLLEELDVGWCAELTSRSGSFTKIAATCKNLKKLFLTANRTVCDVDLLALAKHSRHLQQLDILGTREVSSVTMEKVLSNCPDLVMVDVSFCAGITEPDVQEWCTKYPHINIKKSFQH